MRILKLKSADGEIVEAEIEVVKCCGLLKDMLENAEAAEEDENETPISHVNASVLRKVLQWTEHHKDDAPVDYDDGEKRKAAVISEWDAEFLKVEDSMLFDLILAANFLNVKGLLEVAAKTLAAKFEQKTAEQIRTEFGVKNDFSADEIEEMRKEEEWCKQFANK